MSLTLRIALIIVCVVACLYVLRRIRRAQMEIEDAIYWILVSFALVIISIFPQIPDFLSRLLGIRSPSNFVFLSVIFVVIVKLFSLSLEVSFLKQKLKSTIQNVAIRQKELEDAGKGEPSDAKRDS
ncbi:MAG: DUF2304 domain-containing protein [Lachnospiraceae bacterium]